MNADRFSPVPRTISCYELALRNTLPTHPQNLLLAACLREPPVASAAWRDFVAVVGDAKRFFERNGTGLKGLLPFVESRLAENGIDAGKSFHTYARVALVREALRSRIYLEILGGVLSAFDRNGVSSVLLKGGAVSATVYPQPSRRHNHAIDLWISPEAMSRASSVLDAAQFVREVPGPGAASHRRFRHRSGLELVLHSKPFYLPHFDLPLEEVVGRVQSIGMGEDSARVLSPEDCLVHVLGHSVYSRSRSNLRWVCDAYYLVQSTPKMAWDVVVETATRAGLTLPIFVPLRWLKDTLSVPIPEQTLHELLRRGRPDGVQVEGIYSALLHTSASPRKAFGWTRGSWRTALGFVRFCVAPSPRYMRWRYNAPRWKLPYLYVSRLLRFAARASRRAIPRWRGGAAPNVGAVN